MQKRKEKPAALLINPPVYDFSLYDLFHRPLGLMRIGRWLEQAGYEVSVVDALDVHDEPTVAALGRPKRRPNGTGHFFKQPTDFPAAVRAAGGGSGMPPVKRKFSRYGILAESLASAIAAVKPDIVLITSGMTYWYPGVVEAVRAARRHHPRTPVAVGGVYATLLPGHCEEAAGPDYVVTHAPWQELKKILGSEGLPVPERPPDGRVLLDGRIWRSAGVLKLNEGCPLRCDYCASSLLHPSFEPGDGAGLFDTLHELTGACGIRSFALYDDALLYRKERGLVPFLEKIIESGLDLSFYLPNAIHLGLLDLESASLMKKAGFKEIRLGYESSSALFHERHDDKVKQGDFRDTVGILCEAGFDTSQIIAYVLAGMPRQRVEEVEDSVRHVASLGVRASIAEYSPVPGTGLWRESVAASRYPIEDEPLFQNNSVMPLQWEGFTTADLQRVKDLSRKLTHPAAVSRSNSST